MRSSLVFCSLLVAVFATVTLEDGHAAEPQGPVVRVEQGFLAGEVEDGLRVFRGIPFAAPPTGSMRWRHPGPPSAWQGVREARDFAPACVQVPHPVMNVPTQPVSEDCLYLNVWTPADEAGDELAVLVWIHGGGFAYGSTAMPLFDGSALAKKGVVFVSTTYRLGPLGFLAHPALSEESAQGVSGNYGLLDQVAALQWVADNIAAFGGDPERVTIMGESAGGMSVSLLVQSPLARGLFSGAIAQSGATLVNESGNMRELRDAEQTGARFAAGLGASSLESLRDVPADEILEAAAGAGPFSLRESWPILDGYVVPDAAVAVYRQHRHNDVPILIGNNDREGDLFPHAGSLAEFQSFVTRNFGADAAAVLEAYPARSGAEAERSAAALEGDRMFGVENWAWARLQSRFGESPVYYYHFAHDPPARPGVPPGPIHGAELPYVFGTMAIRPIAWTAADHALSEQLMTYWTNFAKQGDPNGTGLPRWPSFSQASPEVLYFRDGGSELGPVPHEAQISAFDPLGALDE